ncbi:MAG: hypothetical protein P8L44_07935 [Opitutales bacterium]|jgi:hypothetical protein|nr:hypothetical protein [Opitutales bacterium]MDG2167841.1 hypothetical protein [Opitutales bacterium]
MKNFDHDQFSEGDWEEKGELAWNEFDWELFLQRQDNEAKRFIRTYNSLSPQSNRIDETARLMGWDSSDWSMNDLNFDELLEESTWKTEGFGEEDDTDLDPYTLHRHPVYVAVHGLYDSVLHLCESLLNETTNDNLPPKLCFDLVKSISNGKLESLLALQSLDLADYALTVSELKRALKSLNQSFKILESIHSAKNPKLYAFKTESISRLFDIREIWLRVMKDCREELDRRIKDGE